jgi:hypothetical protein
LLARTSPWRIVPTVSSHPRTTCARRHAISGVYRAWGGA